MCGHGDKDIFKFFIVCEIIIRCWATFTATDFTFDLLSHGNESAGCLSDHMTTCRIPIGQSALNIYKGSINTTFYPFNTICQLPNSRICLTCIHHQWFINSCSYLYTVPRVTCPDVPSPIFLQPGSNKTQVTWSDPVVHPGGIVISQKGFEVAGGDNSGDLFGLGFYSVIHHVTDIQGSTSTCNVEFEVTDIRCKLSVWPSNGVRYCDDPRPGSVCRYECNEGYHIDTDYDVITCGPEGNFNLPAPQCLSYSPPILTCFPPERSTIPVEPINSSARVTWKQPIATDQFGEEISESHIKQVGSVFNSGDVFPRGMHYIQYDVTDLNGESESCSFNFELIYLQCPELHPPSGGRLHCDFDDYRSGTKCTFECEEGSVLSGSPYLTCLTSEEYDHDVPSCSVVTCDNPSFLSDGSYISCTNGNNINSFCTVWCKPGFHMITPNNSTKCLASKQWRDGFPRCIDIFGVLCNLCESLILNGNCCNLTDIITNSWIPKDFKDIERAPPCQELASPEMGVKVCVTNEEGVKCKLQCNEDHSVPRDVSDISCTFKNDVWFPMQRIPDCTDKRLPTQLRLRVEIKYEGGDCLSPYARDQIKTSFTSLLNKAIKWKTACPVPNICSAEDVNVECSTSHRRKRYLRNMVKRQSRGHRSTISWYFAVDLNENNLKKDENERVNRMILYNVFFGFAEDIDAGMFDVILYRFRLDYSSYNLYSTSYGCLAGGIYDEETGTCLVCPSGSMYNSTVNRCIECPVGFYQGIENSVRCLKCPVGTMTASVGAKYKTQCQVQCKAGYFSGNGLMPCIPCPDGSTSDRGSTKCREKHPYPNITDYCETSPCSNNSCQNRLDGFRCFCSRGYRGAMCDIHIHPCTYSLCQNGASCEEDRFGSFICRCPVQYTGRYCEVKTEVDSDSKWDNWQSWSSCSAESCGTGIQDRSRICLLGSTNTSCSGSFVESRTCNKVRCPVCAEGELKVPFSTTVSCTSNSSTSTVFCNISCIDGYISLSDSPVYICNSGVWSPGTSVQQCYAPPVWSEWTPWSDCLTPCGGERKRTRVCNTPSSYSGRNVCKGNNSEVYPCRQDYPDEDCTDCNERDLVSALGVVANCTENDILTCHLTCLPGMIFISQPPVFTCIQGIWSPSNNLIPCTNIVAPVNMSMIFTATYKTLPCGDTITAESIKLELLERTEHIKCINDLDCQVEIEIIPCLQESPATVRLFFQTNTVSNHGDLGIKDFYNNSYPNSLLAEIDDLVHYLEDVDDFIKETDLFRANITNNMIHTADVKNVGIINCPRSTISQGIFCVECPPGTYHNHEECAMCPRGTYQSTIGQNSCIKCPFGTTTLYLGSMKIQDCSYSAGLYGSLT